MLKPVVLLAVLLLTACSQLSEYQRPELPVQNSWSTQTSGIGHRDAAKTHWRTYFGDPRLQALIAAALEHNRDLRIAAARVLEARAQYGIVRADRFPAINVRGTGNTALTPAELTGIGSPQTSERYDLSLSTISYELDFWGRIAGLSEAARVSHLASEEARRSVLISLVADVARTYFTLLQMEELTTLAQSTVASREQSLALITKGRDLGGAYDLEFQEAAAMLESARANLANTEHQRTTTANMLNFLVGKMPDQLPTGQALEQQDLASDLVLGLPSEVLLMRPDVMAAEQRLKAAHANIDAARAAFLPKVMLTAAFGLASQGLGGLFTGGGAWSFQPVITAPLFDAGRTAAGVDLAEVRKVIAVAEYEKTIQQAFREVSDLLSARASYTRQLKSAQAHLNAQAKRLEISEARFNAGLISYLEVLAGQRELLSAQQNRAQAHRALLESVSQVYKALGGGDEGGAPGTQGPVADAAKPRALH